VTDIERAARAARTFILNDPVRAYDCARAVLSAVLSEPSEAMVEAALNAQFDASVGASKRGMRAALIAAGKSVEGGE
jgi:hypothetical protein